MSSLSNRPNLDKVHQKYLEVVRQLDQERVKTLMFGTDNSEEMARALRFLFMNLMRLNHYIYYYAAHELGISISQQNFLFFLKGGSDSYQYLGVRKALREIYRSCVAFRAKLGGDRPALSALAQQIYDRTMRDRENRRIEKIEEEKKRLREQIRSIRLRVEENRLNRIIEGELEKI